VQSILILITGLDLQKVFRPVKMEMKHPSYHLMTDEQLCEVLTFSFIFVFKIHHLTYENIDQHGNYDLLRSTHHFGVMVWYLVSEKLTDGLIIDMILRESVVELYHMMYSQFQSAKEAILQQASGTDLLKVRCIMFYLVVFCVTDCYEILNHNLGFAHFHI
ncbi:RT22 protein, partial [Polypterus senegalus]|nr:RT22 protein [Polypterus senegalus]